MIWTKVVKLNTYRITNRSTGESWEGKARSVWEACKKARRKVKRFKEQARRERSSITERIRELAEDCRIEIKIEGKRGSLAKRYTWREIKLPPAYFDRR